MADLRATIQKTIDTFVQDNTLAVKKKDASLVSTVLTEDCVRIYRPIAFVKRYPQFFKDRISNAEYEAQMRAKFQTMQDAEQKVVLTVIDTTERKASLWVEATVFTAEGTSTVEIAFGLSFTEDGTRISEVTEFVDTFESDKVLEQILSTMAA